MSMKRSQLIVAIMAGLATAVGVALATIQLKTSAPETGSSNNTSQSTRSQPFGVGTSPAPSAEKPKASLPTSPPTTNTAKPAAIVVTPPKEGCKISTAIVADPAPPLNVRSSPNIDTGKIIGKLNNGTFVSVIEEKNGWLHIQEPEGWISKNRTESSCANVNKRIKFAPRGDEAIVKGRIIGGGTHIYILQAAKNQTMTVSVQEGPLPFVFSPNDPNRREDLTGGGDYTGKKSWTGQLPFTGDYIIQLDSNFRGFAYEFSVHVK